jgi:hypothetical protein
MIFSQQLPGWERVAQLVNRRGMILAEGGTADILASCVLPASSTEDIPQSWRKWCRELRSVLFLRW